MHTSVTISEDDLELVDVLRVRLSKRMLGIPCSRSKVLRRALEIGLEMLDEQTKYRLPLLPPINDAQEEAKRKKRKER